MKRAIVEFVALIACAADGFAGCANLRTEVSLSVSLSSWSSDATVICEDFWGNPSNAYYKAEHKVNDETFGSQVYYKLIAPPGTCCWSNSASGATTAEHCYRAYASGDDTLGESQSAGSSLGCAAPTRPPRETHGYDLCPVLVDLDGGGIATSGADTPVWFFDSDRDGILEPSGWTAFGSGDAFLWMDLDGDHRPEAGELFGSGMPLPSGVYAKNGFQALREYDLVEFGGNADGRISRQDAVWDRLRLWNDANHDGHSQPLEVFTPGSAQIVDFDTNAARTHTIDPNGNYVMYEGLYRRREHEEGARPSVMELGLIDISFLELANP